MQLWEFPARVWKFWRAVWEHALLWGESVLHADIYDACACCMLVFIFAMLMAITLMGFGIAKVINWYYLGK